MTDAPIRFEVWAPARAAPPPRSRLYHLEPIGIGTPEVESLSSYLNRLAQAHCVTVNTLIAHELLPHVGTPARPGAAGLSPHPVEGCAGSGSRWRSGSMAWGGLRRPGSTGSTGVTGRRDLRFLTLLTWRHVLPDRHLFSRLLRWCPACVEAWRTTGHPLYDPLLWKLNPITACVRHQRRLRSRCRACQQQLTTFSGRSRPGYCSRCGAWLGTAGRRRSAARRAAERGRVAMAALGRHHPGAVAPSGPASRVSPAGGDGGSRHHCLPGATHGRRPAQSP